MSDKILKHIDGSSKVGIDFQYENTFMLIEQEIAKSSSVTQDTTNWSYVYDNTIFILENHTKDLRVVSWWLYATLKIKEIDIFLENLSCFIEFINIFGEELFPKSFKGRTNTINWLEDILVQEFSNKINVDKNLKLKELFEELSLCIQNFLKDDENRFKKIIAFLNTNSTKIKDEIIINKELTEIKKEEQNIQIDDEISAKTLFLETKDSLSKLSQYYRLNDIESLKAIKITRFLAFYNIEDLPYSQEQRTFINPPPLLEIEEIETLIKKEEYKKALCLIEENIEVCPFWLDGHYLAYDIYNKLNKDKNMNEIKNSLINFVKINEEILDLKFSDGTKFCSNKTKLWIKEKLAINKKTETENKKQNENNKLDSIDELLKEDKFEEAIKTIAKLYEDTNLYEEKFNLRLLQAQILIKYDKKDIAFSLVKHLERDIKKFNLRQWNPKLVSNVYLFILNSFNINEVEYKYLQKIYSNLCKLDISKSLDIDFT